MFGIHKKNKKTEEELKAEALGYTKKVQFEAREISAVEKALDNDINAVTEFSPVNYYAAKDEYLLCIFYYNEDYSEIYMRLQRVADDVPKEMTKLRKTDKEIMQKVLIKFGLKI